MSSQACVEEAKEYADEILRMETRGPGDIDEAMRRIELKFGLPYGAQWALRYRPPKTVGAHILRQLISVRDHMRERLVRRIEHDRAINEAKTGLGRALLRISDQMVGSGS